MVVYFMPTPTTNPVAYANFTSSRVSGIMERPISEYANYIDLLRNESPVVAILNDTDPARNMLSTTAEPVGEEEGN